MFKENLNIKSMLQTCFSIAWHVSRAPFPCHSESLSCGCDNLKPESRRGMGEFQILVAKATLMHSAGANQNESQSLAGIVKKKIYSSRINDPAQE